MQQARYGERRRTMRAIDAKIATNIIGIWFLMRRRAWWGDLKIFFATLLGIMHRVAGRVSVSLRQLFLKRFLKMPESGTDPATVRFEVECVF